MRIRVLIHAEEPKLDGGGRKGLLCYNLKGAVGKGLNNLKWGKIVQSVGGTADWQKTWVGKLEVEDMLDNITAAKGREQIPDTSGPQIRQGRRLRARGMNRTKSNMLTRKPG